MPSISKIRLTNVIYENGAKRYNDMVFHFDGHNGAFLLENGGGKTVFIQTVLQAVIPHIDMADRKIKDTLSLEGNPAHIAIEWILNEQPRRYGLTATSLYIENGELKSIKYAYEYDGEDPDSIEELPFVVHTKKNEIRGASRGEINDYYERMKSKSMHAKTFKTITEYGKHIEDNFKIVPNEWRKIAVINSGEGNVDEFFNRCKTTQQLLDYLLIPTVEEAIQGDNSQNFADIFEKQREHFKTNKRLLEEIEQFKQVKEHIDAYVYEYKGLHDAYHSYEANQYQMYRLFSYLEDLHQQNRMKKERLDKEKIALIAEEDRLNHEEESLEVREKEQIIESLDQTIKVFNEEFSQLTQSYDEIASRKQNIEITSLRKKMDQTKERLTQFEERLETLDETLGIEELKEKFAMNSRKIQGYYQETIQRIDDEIRLHEQELERESQNAEVLNQTKDQQEHQRHQIANRLGKLQGLIESITQQMNDIQHKILNNPEEESIVSEYMQWNERLQRNEKQKRDEEKQLQMLLVDNEEKEVVLENTRQNIAQLTENKLNRQYTLDRFEKEQEALILDIESRSHSLYISDSIYTKEESIIKRLTEKRMHFEAKVEDAMRSERIHKNLSDLYEDRERFFVEPLVEKIVLDLKGRVGFVEQGVYYLDTLVELYGLSAEELYDRFPLWAMTIVTTQTDLGPVKKILENYRDRLTYPVLIVTNEQIRQRLEQEQMTIDDTMGYEVYPNQWKNNLNPSKFQDWKDEIIQKGIEEETQRKELSKQLQIMLDLERQTIQFFTNYSYEAYMELKEDIQSVKLEIVKEESLYQEIKNTFEIQNKKMDQIRHTIDTLSEENFILSNKIQQANAYMQLAKKKDEEDLVYEKESRLEENLHQEYEKLMVRMRHQEKKIGEIHKKTQDLKTNIRVLKQQELYKATINEEPIFEAVALKTLEDDRRMIQRELNGIHQDRDMLLDQIKESKAQYTDGEKQLRLKEEEAYYPIESIDVYSEDELSELIRKVKAMEKELDEWRRKIRLEENEKNRYKTLRDDQEQKIIKKYQYVCTFEEGLIQAKERIKNMWNTWKSKIKSINDELEKTVIQIQEENTLIQELKVKNERYGFLVFDEKSIPVESDNEKVDLLDYDYAKKELVAKWIRKLEHSYEAYVDKKKYIEEERNRYIHYCELHIKDFKLKEAAINGVKKKDNYQELVEYQNQMTRIIERNIRIAEEDRRQSDLELQTFLTHLNAYIHQVAMELDTIQKKTRINVDEVSKQIFIFDIPEWNEFEAKEELRKYIENLVEDYDRQSDQDDVDEEKLREQIEQQLSVKNLLTIVLKDKSIKIKCRKVTNDMKINKAPMVWESSNKWSGGEKWSKNMTLFLGILNYLAEKKQYLSQSQKSQRTVILDNPFGKASSKHVLDPVFFIAEKLGFQIIALTAHAEGKFISDYFPVVYSGRLRQASDGDKQVMTNEKFINYAYLHEKSPRSIMRMEEKEQLTFFE